MNDNMDIESFLAIIGAATTPDEIDEACVARLQTRAREQNNQVGQMAAALLSYIAGLLKLAT